jgi:hypothetical protein
MPLTVNNIDFNIEIQPNLESAIDAARQICSLGDRVGVSSDQITTCINEIVTHIREKYTKAILERQKQDSSDQTGLSASEDAMKLDKPIESAAGVESDISSRTKILDDGAEIISL